MAPEVLIVGDASRRAELQERLQKLGYRTSVCTGAALGQRVAERQIPAAVVVCTEDEDPRALMVELRSTRVGSGVPVTLHGPLGGRIGDLVDVLDLGADHFLEEPADDEQLATAITELAGPGELSVALAGGTPHEAPTGDEDPPSPDAPAPDESQTDVVLGQLHRTLDKLEARLRDHEQVDGDADDLDLAELGFAELPSTGEETGPVDRDSSLELALSRSPAPPPPADEPTSSGRRDPTERLDEQAPHEPPAGATPSAPAEGVEDRPRRHAPLPIDNEGSLEEVEVPRLLWTLHRARYTGALALEHRRAQKHAWFREGDIVFVRSNAGHDRLVDGLLRRGLLTRGQVDAARRLAADQPGPVGPRLVEAGLLKAAELPRVMRNHLIRIIDSTFPWTDGTWALTPGQTCEESTLVDTPVPLIIAEGIRHRMESTQLLARLGGLAQFPRFTAEAAGTRALVERLLLSPTEEAWLPRLDGTQRLRALLDDPQADEQELLGLTYTLHVLEHLELLGEGGARSEVEPGSVDGVRIRERLELAREGDYFAALGVPRDASPIDVRRAHAQLRETFADEHLEPDTLRALSGSLAELRDLLDEAREVLVDEALRSAYLAHLEEP